MAKAPVKPTAPAKAKVAKLEEFADPNDFSRVVKQGPLGPVARQTEDDLIAKAAEK